MTVNRDIPNLQKIKLTKNFRSGRLFDRQREGRSALPAGGGYAMGDLRHSTNICAQGL